MSDLMFMMGKFEAEFPTDRQYSRNHMWAKPHGQVVRFGFTAYAVRLLLDVYFLEWCVDEGDELTQRQTIGAIESKKAESDLFAPIDGKLIRFNGELMDDPSVINRDKYAGGWLFELQPNSNDLLTPHEYVDHLSAVWEITQRTLKGQLS